MAGEKRRFRSLKGLVLAGVALVAIVPTHSLAAQSSAKAVMAIDIKAQSLGNALTEVARQTGAEIIFRPEVVRGKRAPALRGPFSAQNAVDRLLAGSGLVVRTTPQGALIVGKTGDPRLKEFAAAEVGAQSASLAAASPSAVADSRVSRADTSDPDQAGIPEILVVGSRSRNVDVRRTENDAQPYVVFGREEITASQATTVEEFLRTRLTQNSSPSGSSSQSTGNGLPFSEFNLRGLGSNQTLILVNGRRLANLANQNFSPRQADINGIPIGSIERIEVLPSSAGGVYGGNAVGGVINIILRRAYKGLEIAATYNDTFDFEAPSGRIDVNGGLSLEDGRTTITFSGAFAKSGTLQVGDRVSLIKRGIDLYRSNVDVTLGNGAPPLGNGVNIRSTSGANLVLDPIYGGTSLGSRFTNVPLGYAGVASDSGALLRANAGTFNLDIPDDLNGRKRGLLTSPEVFSYNISTHRRFSRVFDVFLDHSHLENKGTSFSANQLPASITLSANAPNNPFQQNIRVTYPVPGISFPFRSKSVTDTVSVGTIVRLPHSWGANIEYNRTWSNNRATLFQRVIPTAIVTCLTSGAASCAGGPALNPLQAPIDFSPFLYDEPTFLRGPYKSEFINPSLRMSGPLFQLPGGPANLTFAVQRESTIIKTARNSISDGTEDGRSYVIFPGRKQRTDSQYAEMVLPLIGQSKKLPFVNLLELRGAIRRDAYFTAGPPAGDSFIDFNLGNGTLFTQIGGFGSIATSDPDLVAPAFSPVTSRFRSTNFTFAGRYSPVEGVMFRASYATGFLPPSVVQISSSSFPAPFGIGFRDPQRGNEVISYPLQQIAGTGSTALRPEKSKSLSAGLILTPVDGLRFSADYTRIRKTDEIGSIPHPFLLANPDLFPGRVVRGPASDGFAVGRIITLDVTPINLLRSQVQSVDFQVDYEKGLKQWGQLRLYALASWQPDTVRQLIPAAPSLNFSGNRDGPLEWQGNAGFDWTLGKLTVRWNTQFYDSYRIITTQDISSDFARSLNEAEIKQQGAPRVPSQLYSDIQLSYEMDESWGALGGLRISAGVQNIFNKKPPVIAIDSYQAAGYSTYGDPRLRRFTLTLRKAFFSSAPTK